MNQVKTYELTGDTKIMADGQRVRRIRAIIDIPHQGVRKGDIGGYVQSYRNLTGFAWVFDDAVVRDSSVVRGFASVAGNAEVSGDTSVVSRLASIRGEARITNSLVTDSATVAGNAVVESARVLGNSYILSGAHICPDVTVMGDSYVIDIDVHSSDEVINVFLGGQPVTITPKYIHVFGHILRVDPNRIKIINNDLKSQFTTNDFEWCERWWGSVVALQQAMLMTRGDDKCRNNN